MEPFQPIGIVQRRKAAGRVLSARSSFVNVEAE
jgi:hypothetical protein